MIGNGNAEIWQKAACNKYASELEILLGRCRHGLMNSVTVTGEGWLKGMW